MARSPRSPLRRALPGLALAGGVAAAGLLARRIPQLPELRVDDRPVGSPIIDAIVPVLGERGDVTGCVTALWAAGAQRVIVVSDGMSSAAARIAVSAGAEVVTLMGEAQPGWRRRARACSAGAERATAPWLAFVDPTVRLRSGSLDALAMLCDRAGLDAASPQLASPASRPPRLAETLLALRPSLDERCLLVRRDAYARAGGHAHPAVRRGVPGVLGHRLEAVGRRWSPVGGEPAGEVRSPSARRLGPPG
jgi:hypothetical protein